MPTTSRSDPHLKLHNLPQITGSQPKSGQSTSNNSPIEPPSTAARSPFGLPNPLAGMGGVGGSSRLGSSSPSHELGTRLYTKRAREIQAQEGLTAPQLWGPPASGGSTPLREVIPESPSQDGFPDFMPPTEKAAPSTAMRRARAGTVPSRLSPGDGVAGTNPSQNPTSKTPRPTPSTSPFRPISAAAQDDLHDLHPATSTSALLSRLRAGSLPQRSSVMVSNPFQSSVFAPGWGSSRNRATTLTSIRSSDAGDSPAQSNFSRDGLLDTDVKTLDYLGLAETSPASFQSGLNGLQGIASTPMLQPFLADLALLNKNANRYRSYSVNAKEKYAEDEDEEYGMGRYSGMHSGAMTPSAASAAAALAATQAQIHQHNLAVQAFANQASASRPRARTTGVLDTPPSRLSSRAFLGTPSRLDVSMNAADMVAASSGRYDGLPEAVHALRLGTLGSVSAAENMEDHGLEGPTRALWLGSIPTSTTLSSLQAIFSSFGKIESTRILVQKNCGFVNFEEVDSAIRAKAALNGTEIFPGAGAVRIGYAKVPPASLSGTPGHIGAYPSPSPEPHGERKDSSDDRGKNAADAGPSAPAVATPRMPTLAQLRDEMLKIVRDFGASEQDVSNIAASIDSAVAFGPFISEIAQVPEPSHTRTHDAPKLREIRKRIDNNAISQAEIEEIAIGMLPEISELSSDYLGNTVVQKLFEFCSESAKERMLQEIAPHLAEIGVHKNGTWAAQKIIEVAKTPTQMATIVEALRPYTVALFLDQFGNYVLQCCLRFGFPWNKFIFEAMLSQLWEVAQGRFGARAMRACLESHHATKDQQRMLASAIALHSVRLATNTNGALLLTWLLDTCTFPRRRSVLAPRLVSHLVHLCTHKVAYLTVLKVINQRNEPEARDTVLQALFFSKDDKTLEEILSDQTSGATLIFKILTTPFFDESMRADVVQNVRNVLGRLKANPSQGYKRLMDEVGLSSRNGGKAEHQGGSGAYPDRSRPVSQQGPRSGYMQQPGAERQSSGPFAGTNYGKPAGLDSNGLSPYADYGVNNGMFTPAALGPQQMQYQQGLAAGPARGLSPSNVYGGYPSPSPPFDSYRPSQNGSIRQQVSPVGSSSLMPNPAYASSGFPPMLNNGAMGTYGAYPPVAFYPHQQMQQQTGGRRGRR